MTSRSNLPSLGLDDATWDESPPDPLAEPGYYDGLIWRRVFGFALDVVLVWGANACLWLIGVLTLGLLWPIVAMISVVLPLAYHTYFIGRDGGTPGMSLFDVELRNWNGNRVDYLQAFLQTALFYATIAVTSGLVLVVALFTARNRTLHDILAGTVAIRRSQASTATA